MRVFTPGERAQSTDVYVRLLEAVDYKGKRLTLAPDLVLPSSKTAAGVLSVIPLEELFVNDLVRDGSFKALIVNIDAASVNKAAFRMLISELQIHQNLLVFMNICSAHTLNNSTIWGLGDFPYGSLLREAHVFDAVRDRRLQELAKRCLRSDIQMDQCALACTPEEHMVPIQVESYSPLPLSHLVEEETKHEPVINPITNPIMGELVQDEAVSDHSTTQFPSPKIPPCYTRYHFFQTMCLP